jgi:hypothetical protein
MWLAMAPVSVSTACTESDSTDADASAAEDHPLTAVVAVTPDADAYVRRLSPNDNYGRGCANPERRTCPRMAPSHRVVIVAIEPLE